MQRVILDSSSQLLYQKAAETAPPYGIVCLLLHTEILEMEVPNCLCPLKHRQGEFWRLSVSGFRSHLLGNSAHTKEQLFLKFSVWVADIRVHPNIPR